MNFEVFLVLLGTVLLHQAQAKGWMIDDLHCNDQLGNDIELSPTRAHGGKSANYKELGCDLKLAVLKTKEDGPNKVDVKINWPVEEANTETKEVEKDNKNKTSVNLAEMKILKVPELCGCMTINVVLMDGDKELDSIKKKLEITCPKDGKLTMKPKLNNQNLGFNHPINGLKVTINREGPSMWKRIGHQAVALVVGLRCHGMAPNMNWTAVGNKARMSFGDVSLHEKNLLDGVILKEGDNEIDLENKLMVEEINCGNASLIMSLDSTNQINEEEHLEAGWSIDVMISGLEAMGLHNSGTCNMFPAYEEDSKAWVVYSRPSYSYMGWMPKEVYMVTEKRTIVNKGGSMMAMKEDSSKVVGVGISDMRSCANMDPIMSRCINFKKMILEKRKDKKVEEETPQMSAFKKVMDTAEMMMKFVKIKEMEDVARCMTDIQLHMIKPLIHKHMPFGNKMDREKEHGRDEDGNPDDRNRDDRADVNSQEMEDDFDNKGFPFEGTDRNFNEEFKMPKSTPNPIPTSASRKIAMPSRDTENLEMEMGGIERLLEYIPKLPRTCQSVVNMMMKSLNENSRLRTEVITNVMNTIQHIKEIAEKGHFDLPKEVGMTLGNAFKTFPMEIFLCQKSAFLEAIQTLRKIFSELKTENDNQKNTVNLIIHALDLVFDPEHVAQVVNLLADGCNFVIRNDNAMGKMCMKHKEDKCTKPWIIEHGTVHTGSYSPLIGMDCYSPVLKCDCQQCQTNNWYGTDRPWHGTDRPWHGTDRPWHGTDRPWHGTDRPWHGTDRPWHGTDRPWYGTDKPYYGTNMP